MVKIDEEYFEKTMGLIIFLSLIVLSFLLLRPIILSIFSGLLLAFIFAPVYDWLYKRTKSKNLSAWLIMVIVFIIIFLVIWFLIPLLIDQSFKIFQAALQIDFTTLLKGLFPKLFTSPQFATQVSSALSSFILNTTNAITNSLTNMLVNLPTIALQLVVAFFTFFFVLRDKEEVLEYLKSLLPFPKEVEKKLFDHSSEITKSVIYSHIFIGMIQGLIAGVGFFIFGVPNALFLTILGVVAGILPIVGTPVVWIPVAIYMFIAGNTTAAWGVIIFGIISSIAENILRPIFVSRMTKMHSAVVLISMIGGVFFFGILGFIIGPLVIAYLLIILELYRKKPSPGLILQEPAKESK
ncbi:MAG: AI-2E family transporter [Candidatus Pacearchaeota archaeon]|jgi:predicted PurR-regulated permease PerM